MYGIAAGWFTFRPNETALTHVHVPELGAITLFYMPHGSEARAAWTQGSDGWECCAQVPVPLLGHGRAWQGVRYHDWGSDESAIELAVYPAGLEGFIGVVRAEPEGRPTGDYLLRFRLDAADGRLQQTLRIEQVDCRISPTEVQWYGCGSDPVMAEGDVAPM